MSITGPLTRAPNFLFLLDTERVLETTQQDGDANTDDVDESKRVVTGFGFLGPIGDLVTGAVTDAVKAAVGINPVAAGVDINQINQIIKMAQSAGLSAARVITPEQAAMLGINSSQFYSIIGGAVGMTAQPVQQTVAQAVKINKDFPSLWFVNFPKHMKSQDVDLVHRSRQNMTDFRSWSSQKWWEEVARRGGVAQDMFQRARQSKLFAKVACEDMCKMSWLRTTKPPINMNRSIRCMARMLHQNIVSQVMSDWESVDRDIVDAVEPLLQDIVRSARAGAIPQDTGELKVVILEKYEWNANARSVTSYIRLISFELSEAFYKVISNKGDPTSYVSVDLALLQYEAVFESSLWNQFASTLEKDQKDPFQDFINLQTINVT
ncbi:hypothetical protein CC77DRAFT_1053350 [Alternaria alternata]|uniref:Uncharacterized protein n=1 Tax=Alternaria alternata TaxID=5599 RepID=A0A177DAF0_ALTAL|nr:hypothetical protein CC77DRAFT_1053350 [Alternaria alternata]OAG16713.1 hypothetical protein CC77DRAFT_1053350 [Alternaria alternata]